MLWSQGSMQNFNLYFRIVSGKHVAIGNGPKTDAWNQCVGEQFGKCHASREKLWWNFQQFVVPKGSPLHASIILML